MTDQTRYGLETSVENALRAPDSRSAGDESPSVSVLARFRLAQGRAPLTLSRGSQRLVAFLALRDGSVRRDLVAGILWPAASEVRAHASLRAALTRLGPAASGAVKAGALDVCLADGVMVDLHSAQRIARRLLDPTAPVEPAAAAAAILALSAELLPGWYDDWVILEAENWRQLRLHALEALSASLVIARCFGDAAAAAGAAVSADPLRESAHAALIGVHVAEGNQSEALRAFERYGARLRSELGLEPTERLRKLLPLPAR